MFCNSYLLDQRVLRRQGGSPGLPRSGARTRLAICHWPRSRVAMAAEAARSTDASPAAGCPTEGDEARKHDSRALLPKGACHDVVQFCMEAAMGSRNLEKRCRLTAKLLETSDHVRVCADGGWRGCEGEKDRSRAGARVRRAASSLATGPSPELCAAGSG